MSLSDSDVSFPRFLLIDTPETAGIDTENLITAIGHLAKIVEEGKIPCQIIMTTGFGKYPNALEENVFLRIRKRDGERLLRRLPTIDGN